MDVNQLEQDLNQTMQENQSALDDSLKRQVEIIRRRAKLGADISDEELNVVKRYKGIEIKKPITDTQTQSKTEPGNKDDLSRFKNDPERLKLLMGQMQPILNVPINDLGETIQERLLLKVYGKGNVAVAEDGYKVKNAKGEFEDAPSPALTGGLGNIGRDIVGGITGETVGASIGGTLGAGGGPLAPITIPLGIAAGAAGGAFAGAGLTDAYNKTQNALLARKLGLLEDKDIQPFIGNLAKDTLGLSSLSAGITGVLRAALPEPVKVGLRVAGNTGKEIGQIKATVAEQGLVDDLFKSIEGLPEATDKTISTFGNMAKQAILKVKNNIFQGRDKAFNLAENQFKENLKTGNFSFVDASGAYNKFISEINNFVRSDLLSPEQAKLITDQVGNQLNFTAKAIADGVLEASPNSIMKFSSSFDPQKVTALDLRQTSNVIDNLYQDVPKQAQKALAGLRAGINAALGEDITSVVKGSSSQLAGAKDYIKGIKVPKNAQDFVNFKNAFKISGRRFTDIPEALMDIGKDTDPSEVGKMVRKLSPEQAQTFTTKIVQEGLSPEEQTLMKKGLRFDILNDTRTINRQRTRNVVQDISKEAKLNSLAIDEPSAKALDAAGSTRLDFNPVKESLIGGDQSLLRKERGIVGKGLSDAMQFNKTDSVLLGKQAEGLQKAGNKLAALQDLSGRVSTLQDSAGTALNPGSQAVQNLVSQGLGSAPGGGVLKVASNVMSGLVNPVQRGAADFIGFSQGPFNPARANVLNNLGGLMFGDDDAKASQRRLGR